MMFALLLSCIGLAHGFCEDGIDVPAVQNDDVVITWAQAPLFSTNPEINQTGKYLSLYHTALVFRQGDTYWTLEFDSTADDLSRAIVPELSEVGEMLWQSDARWCLRDGIYNGKDHWTTNFVEVATISAEQLIQTFNEFIPTVNSTVPGAWPQYQFWRVQQPASGETLIDDTTCGHVYRVLEYIRDVHQVTLLDMDYQATRVTLPAMGLSEVDMSDPDEKARVVKFFAALRNAVGGKSGADAFKAIFEFFMPWEYVYDPITRKYFKCKWAAPGEVILIFYVNFETIGDLPPPPGDDCDVAPSCVAVMSEHASYGMGHDCKVVLGSKSDELIAGGCHADATARARDVDCFCGSQCYVASACLEKMAQHCKRGGGQGCVKCIIAAFPSIALFGPCDSGWGPMHIVDCSMSRKCFCDDSQWKPDAAEMFLA